MSSNKPFRLGDRIKSIGFAMEGIITFFKTQHNAWIHFVAAVVVIVFGWLLKIGMHEWCWLIVAIALVFITEMMNTAIEFLSDAVSPDIHPQIKKVKDVAAAAVLIASFAAIAIGLIIFLPKLIVLIHK